MRVCVQMSSLLLAVNFFLPPLRAQGECPIMDATVRCGLFMGFLWLMRRRVELLESSSAGSGATLKFGSGGLVVLCL